ncbi:MAG TPA: hypothetical protein VMJ66_12115 [Geobacteraceae bacterium]|nr:hypothetical protein [Geobacteraceae bacterium]
MTRIKGTPPVHKPAFDEESVLRFAAGAPDQISGGAAEAKGDGADRISISLMLKPEVVARLREEAIRKEKKIEQIIEKLVAKHLGKG